MQWNLHVVGESAEQDLKDAVQTFVEDLERLGHTLTSATLTTDAGQTPVPTAPVPDAPVSDAVGEDTPPTLPDATGEPALDEVVVEVEQKLEEITKDPTLSPKEAEAKIDEVVAEADKAIEEAPVEPA